MNRRLFLALLPAIPVALATLDLPLPAVTSILPPHTFPPLLTPDITPLLTMTTIPRNRTRSTQPLTPDHVTLAYERAFRTPTRLY